MREDENRMRQGEICGKGGITRVFVLGFSLLGLRVSFVDSIMLVVFLKRSKVSTEFDCGVLLENVRSRA